jgi:hypothetical protein
MTQIRGTDQNLEQLLQDSLVWIEIKTLLSGVLRERADKGDLKAVGMLNFLAREWQATTPGESELARRRQLSMNLSDLVARLLYAMHTHGLDPHFYALEALAYGVSVAPHLLEERT